MCKLIAGFLRTCRAPARDTAGPAVAAAAAAAGTAAGRLWAASDAGPVQPPGNVSGAAMVTKSSRGVPLAGRGPPVASKRVAPARVGLEPRLEQQQQHAVARRQMAEGRGRFETEICAAVTALRHPVRDGTPGGLAVCSQMGS